MSKTYRAWTPEQSYLFPPSPGDWLPEGDLVYFVLETIQDLDLSEITARYESGDGRGFPPYHPRMMVTLLVYSYTQGTFGSRRIMKRCERDAAYRVIVGDDIPDFRTISDFRKNHLPAVEELFLQVLQLCRKAGLVKLGHVSLDGTKVKANASRHKAMSYGRMKETEKRLRKEIRELLKRARQTDMDEDTKYGVDCRGDELPEALRRRKDRLQVIKEARKALEAEARVAADVERKRREDEDRTRGDKPHKGRKRKLVSEVPRDKAQRNFTDPETSIMKANNKGFDQCGNAQAVVDRDHQIIIAADVTSQSNDKKQFVPMIEQARGNVGEGKIHRVSADAGYFSKDNVAWAEKENLDAHIATGRMKHGEKVVSSPRGRIPKDSTDKERMARKLRTKKGRFIYAQRKWIIEPVFGQIKRAMGFGQFLLNGNEKMRGEWRMVCMAHNIRKLWAYT